MKEIDLQNRYPLWSMAVVAAFFLAFGLGIGRYVWKVDSVDVVSANVDVVHEVPPMSEVFLGIDDTLEHLASLSTPEQQTEYLNTNHPNLANNVVYWLRQDGRLAREVVVDSVDFRFGSLQNITAESGDGDMRRGFFENQIVAIIHYANGGSRELILRCMNGLTVDVVQLMALNGMGVQTPRERFVIGRGEGLTHYVGFLTAIDIAQRHGLPVYRGRRMSPSNRIGYEEARTLEHQTDFIQVTVYVETGDEFDLRNDTYTSARLL